MANVKKDICINEFTMNADGNMSGKVIKDIGGPTLADVTEYIQYMLSNAQELAKTTLDVSQMQLHLQELFRNAADTTYDLKSVEMKHFDDTGEQNPLSYIASMYMLNKLGNSADKMTRLAAVHNGWAICRLMNLNKEGKFTFNYATNKMYKRKSDGTFDLDGINKKIKDGITIIEYYLKEQEQELNYQTKNIPSLEYLVKLGQNYTSDGTLIIKHLQNNVFVKIHLEKDKFTIIRADQLCMFVPFEKLGTEYLKNVDDVFLNEYVKQGKQSTLEESFSLSAENNTKLKYEIISNLLSFGAQGGRSRRGGSACSHTPSQKRVMIGGKQRVVYQGKRGGEYIKKGGEFITLNKALKAISIK